MEAVQVSNSSETPAEEVTGIVETEEIEVTLEEQADASSDEEVEEIEAAALEGPTEAEEVSSEEDASSDDAASSSDEAAPDVEVEVPAEEQADASSDEEVEEVEAAAPEAEAEPEEAEDSPEERTGTVNGDVPPEEGNDMSQMGGIPVEDWDYQRPKRGEVRSGIILSIGEQEIIVDVGAKRDGIVPFADMQRMGEEALAELRVSSEVPVYILRPEDQEGNLLVSLFMARQQQAWIRAQALADSGEIWEGTVIGYNKGGLVIPVDEIRGFVPASQVPGFPHGLNQEERLARLSSMVDETMPVKVIEINRRKRRLILSATAAQQDWRKQARTRLLSDLREGEVREGTVSSLCSFGAFVDLGGADGLVHLSELSWRRIRHPREAVSVGQKVEVYVLRLDHERQRIGLSLKRLLPEPWALVEDKYELGQLVEGVVTNVVDFGAFAEVEDGVEGLIHVSELAEAAISHPRDVVKKGDLLLLRVIRIDTRRKRLGLSLKRVLESEWSEWAARLAAADMEKRAAAKAAAPAEAEAEVVEEVAEAVEEVADEAEVEAAEEVVEAVAEAEAEVEEEVAEAVAEAEAEVVEEVAEAVEEVADEAEVEAAEEVVEAVAEAEAEVEEEVAEAVAEAEAEVVEEVVEAVEEASSGDEIEAEVVEEVAEAEAEVVKEITEAVAEAEEEAAEEVVEAVEEAEAEVVEEVVEAEAEAEAEVVEEVAEEAEEVADEAAVEVVEEVVEAEAEAEAEAEVVEEVAEEAEEVAHEAEAEVVEEDASSDDEASSPDEEPEPAVAST